LKGILTGLLNEFYCLKTLYFLKGGLLKLVYKKVHVKVPKNEEIQIIMKNLIVSLTIILSTAVSAGEKSYFELINSIIINRPIDKVFEFAANPMNDEQWRSEVNGIDSDGGWEVGTTYREDSTLGLNPHFETITKMTELEYPKKMVVKTGNDRLHLRSERTFSALGDNKTKMTYKVQVDKTMPFIATKLPVPNFLVKFYYGQVMQGYLGDLKNILE
jgi:hypothetical protein